jgi:nucleoside 2-deoxyribosyltransferase
MAAMTIYIAGPMKGYPDNNYPAFDRARDWLIENGHVVVSPADVTRQLRETLGEEPTISQIAKADIFALLQCDTLFMLNGWEHSLGARTEHAIANWMRLAIYYQRGVNNLKLQ